MAAVASGRMASVASRLTWSAMFLWAILCHYVSGQAATDLTTTKRIDALAEKKGQLGNDIAIDYANDNYAVVGAPLEEAGVVYALQFSDPYWEVHYKIQNPESGSGVRFGYAVGYRRGIIAVSSPDDQSATGAVFLFARRQDPPYQPLLKLMAPDGRSGDRFGEVLYVDEKFIFVGTPKKQVGNQESVGAVYVYTHSNETISLSQTLYSEGKALDQFGYDVASSGPWLAIGAIGVDGALDADVGVVYVYSLAYEGLTPIWVEHSVITNPFPNYADSFGYRVDIYQHFMLVSAPDDDTFAIKGGSSYLFRYITSIDQWLLESTLGPDTGVDQDNFGSDLSLFGRYMAIGSPGDDTLADNAGTIYLYRFNETQDTYLSVSKLYAADGIKDDRFGLVARTSESHVLSAAPLKDQSFGAAYTFQGYTFFPIKPPIYTPPGGNYLIGGPFVVDVRARFLAERVRATTDGTEPTIDTPYLTNLDGSGDGEGGGALLLPHETGQYLVKTLTTNDREIGIITEQIYNLYKPTPGYYWTGSKLVQCGGVQYFCPGTVEDSQRHTVSPGFYTVPEGEAARETRSGQEVCPADSTCSNGIRLGCGSEFCFPQPVYVRAREAAADETDEEGRFYQRQTGLSAGDVLMIQFDQPTNQPPINSAEEIYDVIRFSASIGNNLKGEWIDEKNIKITVLDPSGSADPALTAPQTLNLTIIGSGSLRYQGDITQPTDMPRYGIPEVPVTGTWGEYTAPKLLRAIAYGGEIPQNGSGPATGDWLVLTFDVPIESRDLRNEEAIMSVFQIEPEFQNVSYSADYISYNAVKIQFLDVVNTVTSTFPFQYPTLFDMSTAVGRVTIGIKEEAILRSRDLSSPPAPYEPILIEGTWGDVVEDLSITLWGETSANVHFAPPSTNLGYSIERYLVQASLSPEFLTIARNRTIFPSEGQVYDPNVVPFAHPIEFSWVLENLARGQRYYIRCAAYNTIHSKYGPWVTAYPFGLKIDRVTILSVATQTKEIPTTGGLVAIRMEPLGYGRHVISIPVEISFSNGINAYKGEEPAMTWDGNYIECIAPPGVGRGYKFSVSVGGSPGYPAPDGTEVSYRPPRIFDIVPVREHVYVDELGTEPQLVRVIGRDFGPESTENVFWAEYYAREFPEVRFQASCNVTTAHTELTCLTADSAGTDHIWEVNIGGQKDNPPGSGNQRPIIASVEAFYVDERGGVPQDDDELAQLYPRVQRILNTQGGDILIIKGRNFGPHLEEKVPVVHYHATRPVRSDEEIPRYHVDDLTILQDGIVDETGNPRQYYGPLGTFNCSKCTIVKPHSIIACESVEGFGGQLEFQVTILGVDSEYFRTNLTYAVPELDSIPLPDSTFDPFQDPWEPFVPYREANHSTNLLNNTLLGEDTLLPQKQGAMLVTDCTLDNDRLPDLLNATIISLLEDPLSLNGTYHEDNVGDFRHLKGALNYANLVDFQAISLEYALAAAVAQAVGTPSHPLYGQDLPFGGNGLLEVDYVIDSYSGGIHFIYPFTDVTREGATEVLRQRLPKEYRSLPVRQSRSPIPLEECSIWPEYLLETTTFTHRIALQGTNLYGPGYARGVNLQFYYDSVPVRDSLINVNAIPQDPPSWTGLRPNRGLDGTDTARVLGHQLVELAYPAGVGIHRLSVVSNGVMSRGILILNAAPKLRGFMEWRLGTEDIRGLSTPNEDRFEPNPVVGDPGWGGYGAWDPNYKCMKITLVGDHLGGLQQQQEGRLRITVQGRPCEYLSNARHSRIECCTRIFEGEVLVEVEGRLSNVLQFEPSILERKPIIHSLSPEKASTAGGDEIMMMGSHFINKAQFREYGRSLVVNWHGDILCYDPSYRELVGNMRSERNGGDPPSAELTLHETLVEQGLVLPGPDIELEYKKVAGLQGQAHSSSNPSARGSSARDLFESHWVNESYIFRDGAHPTYNIYGATAEGYTWLQIRPQPRAGIINLNQSALHADNVSFVSTYGHGLGLLVQVRVRSPLERIYFLSQPMLLKFSSPRIHTFHPRSLPLTGGLLTIYGESFGSGGRVMVRQRRDYMSNSVPRRLKPIPNRYQYIPHTFVGFDPVRPGGFPENELRAPTDEKLSHITENGGLGVQGRAQGPRMLSVSGNRRQLFATQYLPSISYYGVDFSVQPGDSDYVYTECPLLEWSHDTITCLAPAGMDNESAIIVDLGWTKTPPVVGLTYQPALPCFYNTTFTGTIRSVPLPTLMEQFYTGLWMGALVSVLLTIIILCISRYVSGGSCRCFRWKTLKRKREIKQEDGQAISPRPLCRCFRGANIQFVQKKPPGQEQRDPDSITEIDVGTDNIHLSNVSHLTPQDESFIQDRLPESSTSRELKKAKRKGLAKQHQMIMEMEEAAEAKRGTQTLTLQETSNPRSVHEILGMPDDSMIAPGVVERASED